MHRIGWFVPITIGVNWIRSLISFKKIYICHNVFSVHPIFKLCKSTNMPKLRILCIRRKLDLIRSSASNHCVVDQDHDYYKSDWWYCRVAIVRRSRTAVWPGPGSAPCSTWESRLSPGRRGSCWCRPLPRPRGGFAPWPQSRRSGPGLRPAPPTLTPVPLRRRSRGWSRGSLRARGTWAARGTSPYS